MALVLRGYVVTHECAASCAAYAAKFCTLYYCKYKKIYEIVLFKTNFTYTNVIWG